MIVEMIELSDGFFGHFYVAAFLLSLKILVIMPARTNTEPAIAKIVGISTIKIKTHMGFIRGSRRHISDVLSGEMCSNDLI